jgi:hypothetical protein
MTPRLAPLLAALALVLAPVAAPPALAGTPAAEAPAAKAPAADEPDRIVLASIRPRLRADAPEPQRDPPSLRCTRNRSYCIALGSYLADVCRTIEATARANALDPHFFARLLWKESLFDAAAVSPAGAQGIAQFMPGTAALRGLEDPFNPAEALAASAHYLAELAATFGNLGLAAVAYNGGEARAERFVAEGGALPAETRDYVQAITGHPAETWRDAPPATLDLALEAGTPFQPACVRHAGNRTLRAFRTEPQVLPWGVVVASNRDRSGAERQVARLQNRHAAVLRGEAVTYTRTRRAGMPAPLYYAQVGRPSRDGADALCARLRATGGDCMVLRN